ncbi:hypothetical protein BGZ59_008152 [Podila verticillata]|nr:hypothetical protein BGZ59_008152 [Podila verticillata]KFH64840.1 hypothetical protein MVEG_09570 [Podila verticillata NRRL 6337]
MPKHKYSLDHSYSSSDDEQPEDRGVSQRDLEEEAEQFKDPMHRGRRKRTKEERKADAIYGSFIESDDDDSLSRPGLGGRSAARRRTEFEFVPSSSSKHEPEQQKDDDNNNENDNMESDHRDNDSSRSESDMEMETAPVPEPTRDRPKSMSGHGSMGFFKNRAGFDSGSNSPSPRSSSPASMSSPRPDMTPVAPVKVGKDYGAFSAKGSGFGLKMLEKMGWKKGYGLGAGGVGIVEPIQTKLRPVKMGIGFKGFKEKTDQDRAEEKRRGYAVSSEEDDMPSKPKKKSGKSQEPEPVADGWKKSSARASRKGPKIEYKTAAEIQQEIESTDQPMTMALPQKILDMTGKTVRELSSASQISSAIARSGERFPELRHNLELMADISTTDLEQLARKQKADHVRQEVLQKESVRIQELVTQDDTNIERLLKVMSITDQCSTIANEIRQATSDTTGVNAVEIQESYITNAFQEPFDLFAGLYFEEYREYELDQVFVSSIQDSFKRLLKDWDVLKNPTLGAAVFRKWQKLLKTSRVSYTHTQQAMYDERDGAPLHSRQSVADRMTAYESLLNHHWLPKVRSAINNQWSVRDCDPIIELLEAWTPILPLFIQDNIITQLVMPKLQKEVEQWSPRDSLMLHTWVHPWLPVIGEARLEQELFGDIRRKLASGLTAWTVLDPSALRVLEPWRSVFDPTDMELLLLKSVLPKLVEGMQQFEINPRDQKVELLQAVLPWYHFFTGTTFSALLVNEFFPKWHQVLYLWLSHPSTTDLDQVSQWYQWWKSLFPAEVLRETAVATGFRQGLDMINQHMAGLKIMPPADLPQPGAAKESNGSNPLERLQIKKHMVQSVSFKDLVQDYAGQNSLLFVMTRLMHERSGRPLYRLGGNSTGTAGGVLVHMTDEVAFVKSEETGIWMPVGIEELMVLGGAGKGSR